VVALTASERATSTGLDDPSVRKALTSNRYVEPGVKPLIVVVTLLALGPGGYTRRLARRTPCAEDTVTSYSCAFGSPVHWSATLVGVAGLAFTANSPPTTLSRAGSAEVATFVVAISGGSGPVGN
jgi:hypothetical protein